VAIDVSALGSPGWRMRRLFNMLGNRDRQQRLGLLHDYRAGRAPLPVGAENAREAFEAFQRKARSNFAELITAAVSERMTPNGFRTALDSDETGDREVGDLWYRAGMDVTAATVHDMMLSLSEAYVIVGGLDPETGSPVVTAEDPRFMVGERYPDRPRWLSSALKVVYDDATGEDRAYLYLAGSETETGRAQVWVARRRAGTPDWSTSLYGSSSGSTASRQPTMSFSPTAWEWVPERSGELLHSRIPVVRYDNKDGVGEYETHTDLLDRINHQILQRMVIATMQAFRQRAVKGLPLQYPAGHPKAGQEIDYSDVFTADPAALWQLPAAAEMWESGQVDLTPILSAVKDDVQHLAAVTRTPVHMLMPAGVNQSAEGASLSREGLIFKANDRITRTSYPHAQVMSLMLLAAGQTARADLSKLRTIWAAPERLSLAERADAASKAPADIPRRSRLIHIWGFAPDEADRMMSEWADEQLLQAQLTAAAVAATQPAAPQASAVPAPSPAPAAERAVEPPVPVTV
jgi:hypothetical protein